MEKRNGQCSHREPMEQTRSLFCAFNSGVARCQAQHQYHILQMNSCLKRIARASEFGSCQSNSVSFMRL